MGGTAARWSPSAAGQVLALGFRALAELGASCCTQRGCALLAPPARVGSAGGAALYCRLLGRGGRSPPQYVRGFGTRALPRKAR